MKINKIFTIALASLAFFAVSCTPTVNPEGDAAVGFSGSEFESGLGSKYVRVPIVTTGETTVYPIKVQIDVAEYTGDFAAVEDVDYMITSKEILVASAESTPSVEVKILNPEDADALYFKLKIVSQENAQSVSQSEVLVKCEKSELDRICGDYLLTGQNHQGGAVKEVWTVSNKDGKVCLHAYGLGEKVYITGTLEDGVITFPLGSGSNNFLGHQDFGAPVYDCYMGPTVMFVDTEGYINLVETPHELKLKVADDFKSLSFMYGGVPEGSIDAGLIIGLYTYDTAQTFTGYTVNLGSGPSSRFIDNNTIVKQ